MTDTRNLGQEGEALPTEREMHFGEYLRQERLRLGLSLPHISAETGIKMDNLTALEAGDRRKLPADVFVRGFIRMYAKLLGMDGTMVLDAYVRQWGFSDGLGNREFLDEETMAESSSIFRNGHFLLLVVIAIVVAAAYLAFNILYPISQLQETERQMRPVPQEVPIQSETTEPPPTGLELHPPSSPLPDQESDSPPDSEPVEAQPVPLTPDS